MSFLPRNITKIDVPPIKCQGIKTKLVKFISQNIQWDGNGRWIEPFLGSGVVAFNIRPDTALLADTNSHIINFYKGIQKGEINKHSVREVLEKMGEQLSKGGVDYYYEVRNRFNKSADSFDFLFLNRSCFNGLMRFNGKGNFNVPFGHKPQRFSKAYVTKIVNQVNAIAEIIRDRNWKFIVSDWEETLTLAQFGDFVYLDPPYIGRHADYFNTWDNDNAIKLSEIAAALPCEYALSMWLENQYRRNTHVDEHWHDTKLVTFDHFYHIGSTESLRNSITEALLLKIPTGSRVEAV
ncbi:MAG TPA: Dam family site-specific DNA-(adenine-N6)-methyltransferase [Chitinophagaceae bacterium]|nr:Dam family site-specific DNA-(adenine-N6)-methyltransferase [Chitinophagaceae bacterium]